MVSRPGIVPMLLLAWLWGCGSSNSGIPDILGSVCWPGESELRPVELSSGFFLPDPTDDCPNQLVVVVTNVDTDCEDLADGVVDAGGFPKTNLILVIKDNVEGTYQLTADPEALGQVFSGSLDRIEEDDSWQNLGIVAGTLEILHAGEAELMLRLDVELVDQASLENPAGHLSGRISARACSATEI